jgi:membrane protease YdiL (CAAX protease family)
LDLKVVLALPGLAMVLLSLVLGSRLGLSLPIPPAGLLALQTLTVFAAIAALSALMERTHSFRSASDLLEDVLRRVALDARWALLLSLSSAFGEELFFRWLLLGFLEGAVGPAIAVALQAVLFAALHPAPRAAWAYPLWTLLAGLVFGAVALASGSPAAGILAHYLFNHLNFNAALVRAGATEG